MAFIVILIQSLVVTAWLVVLIRVLMSWVDPQFQKPISQFVYSLTEPVLAPLRNVLPKAGMFVLVSAGAAAGPGLRHAGPAGGMTSGVVVEVRVTPRASQDTIEGVTESGALRVRVTAAPADGAATKAVLGLVAKAVHVPGGAVTLLSGARSRTKRLRIDGIEPARVQSIWPGVSARAA
jgi:uncharacterized protein (TIGR00251 family)